MGLGSREKDRLIEKNYEIQFLINSIFKDEIERKINLKKRTHNQNQQ
jgi:hypothetical protein